MLALSGVGHQRERERLHLSSHTGLKQELPGHALADSFEHIKQKVAVIEDGCNTRTSQHVHHQRQPMPGCTP